VDVEAEILDLKLRVKALEAGARCGDPTPATMAGMAEVKAEIADFQTEVRQDIAVLSDELGGLRRHTNEHFRTLWGEMLAGLISLCGNMIELRLILIRLLGKDKA
jgi:hypothetical protein